MTTNGNDYAYPIHSEGTTYCQGLTKREYFASQILSGLVSQDNIKKIEWLPEEAVRLANKLINELNERKNNPIEYNNPAP